MTRKTDPHNQAMDLVELAMLQRLEGNMGEVSKLYAKALELELSALEGLDPTVEPTYSVMHRSAATLALQSNQPRLAQKLAAIALSHDPPPVIAEELRDVIEKASQSTCDSP